MVLILLSYTLFSKQTRDVDILRRDGVLQAWTILITSS